MTGIITCSDGITAALVAEALNSFAGGTGRKYTVREDSYESDVPECMSHGDLVPASVITVTDYYVEVAS